MIKLQIETFIKAPQMICICMMSLLNFLSLIYCQTNFSSPKLLFISLFIQALLEVAAIISHEFIMFVVFLVTGWIVPAAVSVAATKSVSVIIYNGVFFYSFI